MCIRDRDGEVWGLDWQGIVYLLGTGKNIFGLILVDDDDDDDDNRLAQILSNCGAVREGLRIWSTAVAECIRRVVELSAKSCYNIDIKENVDLSH